MGQEEHGQRSVATTDVHHLEKSKQIKTEIEMTRSTYICVIYIYGYLDIYTTYSCHLSFLFFVYLFIFRASEILKAYSNTFYRVSSKAPWPAGASGRPGARSRRRRSFPAAKCIDLKA